MDEAARRDYVAEMVRQAWSAIRKAAEWGRRERGRGYVLLAGDRQELSASYLAFDVLDPPRKGNPQLLQALRRAVVRYDPERQLIIATALRVEGREGLLCDVSVYSAGDEPEVTTLN